MTFIVEIVDIPAEFTPPTFTEYPVNEFNPKNVICLLNTLYIYNDPYAPETGILPIEILMFIDNDVALSPPV